MSIAILRGDARDLPLPDASVDLVVCSPPYLGLRSYVDGGEHYAGQIGSEATPSEYVGALVDCTREWMRVLKPSGSMFIVLGDSYYSGKGAPGKTTTDPKNAGRNARRTVRSPLDYGLDHPRKSLLGLPWRYALACTDQLGLILRRDIVWQKPNSLPESVTDRCRSSHEYIFHLAKQPRYYSAVDEIREPHAGGGGGRQRHAGTDHYADLAATSARAYEALGVAGKQTTLQSAAPNLLGKLPGSVWEPRDEIRQVIGDMAIGQITFDQAEGRLLALMRPESLWEIPSQPLVVPESLGISHFAAYPAELPRRIILGWSPPGICTACGEGRRPVVTRPGLRGGDNNPDSRNGTRRRSTIDGGSAEWARRIADPNRITGYACACTPFTSHYGKRGDWKAGREVRPEVLADDFSQRGGRVPRRPGDFTPGGRTPPPEVPKIEYHFDQWTPPPTRPSVVLDPFGGTGTSALVADVLGRHGISVDRSMDYARLARWRTTDPGERARAMQVPKPPVVPDGQLGLFDAGTAS